MASFWVKQPHLRRFLPFNKHCHSHLLYIFINHNQIFRCSSEGFVRIYVPRNDKDIGEPSTIHRVRHRNHIIYWYLSEHLWGTVWWSCPCSIKLELQTSKPVYKITDFLLYVSAIVWITCPLTHNHYVWWSQNGLLHSFQALNLRTLNIDQGEVNYSILRKYIINSIHLNLLTFDTGPSDSLISKYFWASSVGVTDCDISFGIFVACSNFIHRCNVCQTVEVNILQNHVMSYTERFHNE